ncbi:hypothetical protein PYW07_008652 [Mythimna separata]|uniref:Ketosynthase family 3 (KS3) domain-containing protein n=1 Tax=Mythimna separata TaxID=271217 RepID=A0AAD7YE62_MYTSE|nr:hypothetical protein PYW07_008652 [Mythimna separata]
MSGLYPDSHSVKNLSDILYNKVNPVTKAGLRFKYNHPEVVQYSGSVPGLSYFDAQFFKVHYRLANCMDPMARKILEQSYQAIYDAGVNPEDLSGKKIGVYIGTCFSEAEKACFYEAASRSGFGIAGCSKTMFANRISYWLNAKGPSMSIDLACCSSTAALEQAYLALSRGECEAAIVGGAYLCLHPQSAVHYGRLMKLCQDGKTKSFGEDADGCAKSEAINVLFLQKAKDALRIYADVLHAKTEYIGILPGQTGPQFGFYRDLSKTVDFIKNFYNEAKVPARAIEYVEALGCAVPEADTVELQAIEEVFCNAREDPLLLGSVMSNIGYNEAASGITAITKVLLGYHFGQLAANLHCENPRQDVVALREGRMRVISEHQPFNRSYVAVNGMSVTGVNSHVLLHGHYKPKDPNRYKSSIAHLVTISARHEAAVTHCLGELKANPIDPEQLRLLHNIHQTNISGHLGRGFVILQTNEEQKTVCLSEKSEYFDDARRPLWFVYSGMGSQWAGMGTQLMRIPIFAAAIERCHKVLEPRGLNIVDILTSPDESTFDNILHSFVGIAAVQIGLTDILKELGLVPDGIIGHSVGELGCAYADGCLSAEEMILAAYSRGRVSLETKFIRGSMAAIGLGYEQILPLCPPAIQVACHNGPESSTISGPAEAMKEFVAELTAKGIFAKEVPCSNIAYHSQYIADAGPQLLKYLSEVIKDPKPRTERWLSTSVPEEKWNDPIAKLCSAEYHTNNLLSPVLFEETSRLIPNNAVCVEVAPHGLLQAILKRSLPSNCKNIALTRRKHADNTFLLLEGIGKLFMEGYNPKVHILYPKVELPVSTGTPFLSHLVQWAHGEKWPLPMYRTANRITASSLDYITSVQDTEHAYLKGHSMRGHNVYPYAATLGLVWDTFAMVAGQPKKEISVEFSNLHLYAQPIIHDQRQVQISIAFHRGNGHFEILNEGSKVATGCIKELDDVEDTKLRNLLKIPETKVTVDFTSEDIYSLLRDRDYSYSGEFLSLEGANKSLTEASVVWRDNWVTFIDGLLQLNMLRQPHDGVSLVTNVRNIKINVKYHKEIVEESFVSDYKVLLKASVLNNSDITSCGGVTISNVKLENMPPVSNRKMALQTLKFVPHLQSDIPIATSLQVYLQAVAENLNKANINVVGLVSPTKGAIFTEIKNVVSNISGLHVKYEEVSRALALKKQKNFLNGVDLVLVENLSTDNDVCQLLHRFLQRDQFVASEEGLGGRSRPASLYRVVSVHGNGNKQQSQLLLARWGASAAVPTTTVTVRTNSDMLLLITTRNNLSAGHRLLIISPYPALPGLKELVSSWRREANRNKIHLIMVSEESNESFYSDDMPDIDLAFNVVDNGKWGGEYYVPVEDCRPVSKNMSLQCSQFGDLDTLTWVEAPEPSGSGVPVKVHYAGISYDDVKKASGSLSHDTKIKNSFGMEFSGTTANGSRVMGLVRSGAAGSVVRAQPELLWPVPAHWSLEEAATVPLAYVNALYCLVLQNNKGITADSSVLVHGGAGAFGQAVISIALALGIEVFTTVSDMRKKHFLRKLFPGLKAEHIGNSRDHSFADMILSKTNGDGCTLVISGLGQDLKNTSISCTKSFGLFVDVSQLHNQDDFAYGMYNLTKERSYKAVDLLSIFEPEHIEDAKLLQTMLSHGISQGYVRPLSRVSYAPSHAASAFRLLAGSKHRGRVLLNMGATAQTIQPRLTCKADRTHLILCNDDTFGLQLADRLVERGSRKLAVHFKRQSTSYLQKKIGSWQQEGVEVKVFSDNLSSEVDVNALINNVSRSGPIEGVYVTVGDKQKDVDETLLKTLDSVSRKLCKDIKYFAVLNTGNNTIGKEVCLNRVSNNLPATILSLPELNQGSCNSGALYRGAVEATEKALRGGYTVVSASTVPAQNTSLAQKIIALAEVTITAETNQYTTLEEMGVQNDKIPLIYNYLRINYNVVIEEEKIPLITLESLQQLQETIFKLNYQDSKGLSTFFTFVDSDELLATTDFVCMPTLVNNASMRDDEFDSDQTYLCVIPGMEGHYERFRVLCNRLKLPALVLQLGLDNPAETIQETAERLAVTFLKKTGLKNQFYLLGYESGVFVALEMAAILESHGLTGTVYCVGYAPDEFDVHLDEQLADYETEEQLQDAVARHMFTLMAGGDTTGLDEALQSSGNWSAKVDACVRTLLGRVSHSAQYARALIEASLTRVQRARGYVPRVHALRSQLVLLRPASSHPTPDLSKFQRHSQRPVILHQLGLPLAHAPEDLQCAAIVNTYLDPTILESFNKKNICNTYLMNANSFMALDTRSN